MQLYLGMCILLQNALGHALCFFGRCSDSWNKERDRLLRTLHVVWRKKFAKYSRKIREKFAKYSRKIREKFTKNLRKIRKKIEKNQNLLIFHDFFTNFSRILIFCDFFAIFSQIFRKFFAYFSRIFRKFFAYFSRIFREFFGPDHVKSPLLLHEKQNSANDA